MRLKALFPCPPVQVLLVLRLMLGDLHLHDLRHEAISRLFAAGYRIEQVALVSGHRDWAMLRRYTHVKAEDLHRAATR